MAAESDRPRGWRPPWELWGVLGLFTLFLFPAIKTGYYAEDLIHSMTPGIARVDGISIPARFFEAVRYNLAVGRFYPVTQLLHVGVHGLVRDVLAYKVVLVAGTVFDMMLFSLMARRLTQNAGFACLASCLTIGLVQFRNHPDPVLGYYLQVQLVAAGLFFSLLALLLYLEGRGKGWLAASAASYLLIAMTYEITYPFFATHFLLIWRGRATWKGRLLAALPTMGVVLACGVTTVVVRKCSVSQDYYVHKVDFQTASYLKAIWHQASAALPMSYLLGDPHSMFPGVHGVAGYALWALRPMPIVVALAAMGFAFRALRMPGNGDGRLASWSPSTVGLGLLLILLPTVLIALSPFHQTQFHFGVGWVPVLIECYGMGLVLATALWWLISLRPLGGPFSPWKSAGVAAMVAVVTGVTYRANQEVATCLNAPWGTRNYRAQSALHGGHSDQERRLLESALRSGLMEDVPERSVVLLAHEYAIWQAPLESVYFYATYASKVLVTEVPSAHDPASKCHEILMGFLDGHSIRPLPGRPYQLRDVCLNRKSGYVVLSRSDVEDPGRGAGAADGELRLFVRNPGLFRGEASPGFRVVTGPPPGAGNPADASSDRLGNGLTLLRSGPDWGLYSLRAGSSRVEPDALRVVFDDRPSTHR